MTDSRPAVSILGLLIVSLLLPAPAQALGVSRIDAPEHFEIRLDGRTIALDAVDDGYHFRDLADPSVEGFIGQDAIDRSTINVVRADADRVVATLVTDGGDGLARSYAIEGSYDSLGTGFSGTLFTPSGSSSTFEISGVDFGGPGMEDHPSPSIIIFLTAAAAAALVCGAVALLKECIGRCVTECVSQGTTMCSASEGLCGTCKCVCSNPGGNCTGR